MHETPLSMIDALPPRSMWSSMTGATLQRIGLTIKLTLTEKGYKNK